MLLTVEAVAKQLGISRATVYNWVAARTIPHLVVNGRIRFDAEELRRWLDRQRVPSRGEDDDGNGNSTACHLRLAELRLTLVVREYSERGADRGVGLVGYPKELEQVVNPTGAAGLGCVAATTEDGCCVVLEEVDGKQIHGRAMTVAERLSDDRVLIAKWIRRLTNWNGRQAAMELWKGKIAPLVEERLAQAPPQAPRPSRHQHDHGLFIIDRMGCEPPTTVLPVRSRLRW